MSNARQSEKWNHTASLMALIANINRNTKKRRRPFQPKEFHPDHHAQSRPKPEIHRGKGFARKCFLAFAGES